MAAAAAGPDQVRGRTYFHHKESRSRTFLQGREAPSPGSAIAAAPAPPIPTSAGIRRTTRWSRPGQPGLAISCDTCLGLAGRLISIPLGGARRELVLDANSVRRYHPSGDQVLRG